MAQHRSIDELPTELIDSIFSHVEEQETIQQSRLVSRRFNDAASQYLITNAQVCMTSESLSRFEELCNHPVFGKSIADVTIVLSYYDTDLANNRAVYLQDCDTQLYQHLEILERMGAYRYYRKSQGHEDDEDEEEAEREEIEKQLWAVSGDQQLIKISEEGFDESTATPFQKLLIRTHNMYKQRCEDQEEVRKDNKHISRLCVALAKLPSLENLIFKDEPWLYKAELDESDFKDLGFKRGILQHLDHLIRPSKWCGTFTTAYSTSPPLEMLGELCSQLGQSGIRPKSIMMNVNAPSNLRPIQLSSDQQSGLRDLVSKAIRLELIVDGWARKGSLAENNNRPRDEMLALCSFTYNFFSAPHLESLHNYFVQYPRFYETPNVSLADILPIEKPWPQLSEVNLRYQPATIKDLRTFVASQAKTVEDFTWECGWLLSGRWDEAVEVLRGFEVVEEVSMNYPKGERYGQGNGLNPDVPYEEIYRYIRKETDTNPLGPESTVEDE